MKHLSLALSLVYLALLTSCSDPVVGSKERPFSMYFIPSVDAQKLTTVSVDMAEFVSTYVSQKLYSKDTGFYAKASVPTSYIAVVEAFGTHKADFATFTTFSYILTRDIKKYPVEAALMTLRVDGEKTYKGQILTRADSGINKVEDLNGKTFAYTDAASTSGYILPSKLLKDKGVQLKQSTFALKHDNVVTMVYQGQVDAGATYYSSPLIETDANGKTITKITDARARVKTQFPDVEEKIKVIAYTDSIPNEPWVLRSNLYEDPAQNEKVKILIVEALIEFSKTPKGQAAMKELASATALERVTDQTYDGIRNIILSRDDLDLENAVKQNK